MASNLPFKQGSKSFLIAQKMLEMGFPGDPREEKKFIRELSEDHRASEKTVRNTKSALRGLNLIKAREAQGTFPPSPPSPPSSASLKTPSGGKTREAREAPEGTGEGESLRRGSVSEPGKEAREENRVPQGTKNAPEEDAEPYQKELAGLKNQISKHSEDMSTLKKIIADRLEGDGETAEEQQENIKIDSGSLVARQLYLTPKTLMLFDIAVADGYPGDLSTYMNDVVTKFYAKRGLALGLIEHREL